MPLFANVRLDFGYPWWLSYGQLVVLIPSLLILVIGYWRHWSKWANLLVGMVVLWSCAALLVSRFALDINGVPSLPTQNFFRAGAGRVLDMGAGTGRSTIMVLEARPQAKVVALDLFAESFDQHFGHSEKPQDKLLRNLKAAGVDQRATIETGDMRKLPFEPASFDAIVSAYAVDHLNREGIKQALSEADRVVKPGGDFLLILVGKEPWVQFALGPLIMHAGTRGREWWTARLQEAGFQVLEDGTRPATLYLLARKL